MPRSNIPEQMRKNATRSRCLRSMFAWILNTKPENCLVVGSINPAVEWRAAGAGA